MKDALRNRDKRAIAERVRKVFDALREKNGISRSSWCKQHGFKPVTAAHYVKDRINTRFISTLHETTDASLLYIYEGKGEMFIKKDESFSLTTQKESSTSNTIQIPFGWELSSFSKEKVINPSFFIIVPRIVPFANWVDDEEEKMLVAALVDEYTDLSKSDLRRDEIVFFVLDNAAIQKGKTYIIRNQTKTYPFKVQGKAPDLKNYTVIGRTIGAFRLL